MMHRISRILLAVLILALIPASRAAQAQRSPELTPAPGGGQITGPIVESNLQRLSGNPGPSLAGGVDLGRVANDFPQQHILMMLKRPAAQQQALDHFMQEQYDRHSANYHKWLSPEQLGLQFGPSAEDLDQITAWLTHHGFTINRVAAGRTFIDFSGTAGLVAAAFHTEIHRYQRGAEEHFANASEPLIPSALGNVVSGFRSLNDFHPKAVAHTPGLARLDRATGKWSRSSRGHFTTDYGAGTDYLVGPQDFAQIYNIHQVWQQKLVGTGQTIAVIGDTDLDAGDIKNFRDQFGISALGPNGSVVVDHPPAAVCAAPNPSSPDLEGYIDAEWAGATAPDATIDFVTCADSGVTSGTDLAATYVVEDAAHAQRDAVLSSSYGYCEQNPQSESNQFYIQLWQQAAAEGITVVVASGDAGGAECDEPLRFTYVNHGLAVNGEASTPYNIAAGGTDFSDVFSGTTGQYWSATNGSTLESAQSYIPEMPWDETCGSPVVLQGFNKMNGTSFTSGWGANGLCTYASTLPDNFFLIQPTFIRSAGSGGMSTVSPRPAWQAGVAGLPGGNARVLPDVSMFSSSGLFWGHSLLFCFSGNGSGCDFSNANTVYANTDGGTSFVAPAFSGVMALINQKTGDRQGQANNVLYSLAAQQFISSSSTTEPNLATCAAYLGPGVLPACYFHDVSSTPNPDSATQKQIPFLTGTTSVPCTGSATAAGVFTDASTDPAANSENCYGYQITVTGTGNSLTTTPNYYGVLSTSGNAGSPAFAATPGYDLATGLGTPNVYALVNAPQWAGLAITTTTPAPGIVGVPYSQTLTATGRVAPYTWSVVSGSLPAGLALGASTGVIAGTPTVGGNSTFTLQVADAEGTPVTATAIFTLSVSAAAVKAASITVVTASTASAAPGANVGFTANVSGNGGTPTGTVTFYNGTTSLGAATLSSGAAAVSTSFANAGTYAITAVYSGDANFLGSTSLVFTETIAAPGFAAALNPAAVSIPFSGTGTVTVVVTPQGGYTGPVNFSCGTLPRFFSCSFASASLPLSTSGGAVNNVLTINAAAVPGMSMAAAGAFLLPVFAGLLLRGRRRRAVVAGLCCVGFAVMSGCGRGDHQAPLGSYSVPVTVSGQGAATQSVTVAVTVE